jgi:nitrous oxidase accessory protein
MVARETNVKRLGRLLFSIVVLATLSGEGSGASAAPRTAIGAPQGVGPRPGPLAPDAVLADSEESLLRLVAAPDGPRRIGLGPRTYRVDLVVKRPVEIAGTLGTVLEGTGLGSVVTIASNDVTVRDVTVRHSGRRQTTEDAGIRATGSRVRVEHVSVEDTLFGVSFEQCSHCLIEGTHVVGLEDEPMLRGDGIKLWESSDSIVKDSLVEDSRDLVVWYSRRVTLQGDTVRHSRYGAHFMYAHDSIVRRLRVENNIVGVFVMYSSRVHVEDTVLAGARGAAGMGIGFKDSDDVELRRSWFVGNTVGTYFDSTPRSPLGRVTFEDNVVALNGVGLRLHSSERGIAFSRNDFHENAAMVEVEGGGNARTVLFDGNYFSDYEGYDLDRDGNGDIPYEEKLLSSVLTDAHPVLKLFEGTMAMGMVDAVSRAVPVLATRTMLTDEHPRMRPRSVVVR